MKFIFTLVLLICHANKTIETSNCTDENTPISFTKCCRDGQNGRDGVNGRDGLTIAGPTGPQGRKGDTGAPGIDGKNGKDGINGKAGANGRDGVDGKPGARGPKGDTGASDTSEITKLTARIGELTQQLKATSTCMRLEKDVCDQCACVDRNEKYYCDCTLLAVRRDCSEHYRNGIKIDGTYRIRPDGGKSITASCDMKSGGWTIIQRRFDGRVDFFKPWSAYKNGFGQVDNEHYLGNDNIHALTISSKCNARFDVTTFADKSKYAQYAAFRVASEAEFYKLTFGSYSGNAGDALASHNNMKFSTFDRDLDTKGDANCAQVYKAGFWYEACHLVNINGRYFPYWYEKTPYAEGITWHPITGYHTSLKSVTIKVRGC